MAVSRRTLAAVRSARAAQDGPVNDALDTLFSTWGSAWGDVVGEWEHAIAELVDLGDGDWPTPTQIRHAQGAANALKVTTDALTVLSLSAASVAIAALPDLMAAAETGQEAIARAQLPTAHQHRLTWEAPERAEVDAIVRRATQRIHSLTRPLSREAEAQMKATLIRGVTVGENPRRAASRILQRVEGHFNGGRSRAETITTTEMLDAHRHAAVVSRKANTDVLSGWIWLATLDKRTCPACLAMNGSKHSTDEFGPAGHQRCRCTAVPDVRSWRSLGIDLDEPVQTFPDAREWFGKLPRADREVIMGKRRLAMLEDGRINWSFMATKRSTPGWRDSYGVRALPPQ